MDLCRNTSERVSLQQLAVVGGVVAVEKYIHLRLKGIRALVKQGRQVLGNSYLHKFINIYRACVYYITLVDFLNYEEGHENIDN